MKIITAQGKTGQKSSNEKSNSISDSASAQQLRAVVSRWQQLIDLFLILFTPPANTDADVDDDGNAIDNQPYSLFMYEYVQCARVI